LDSGIYPLRISMVTQYRILGRRTPT